MRHGGFEEGPMDWALVLDHAETHTLGPNALIRPEDETEWRSIEAFPELWNRIALPFARRDLKLIRLNLLPSRGNRGWLSRLIS
jgi:hypothetical protein